MADFRVDRGEPPGPPGAAIDPLRKGIPASSSDPPKKSGDFYQDSSNKGLRNFTIMVGGAVASSLLAIFFTRFHNPFRNKRPPSFFGRDGPNTPSPEAVCDIINQVLGKRPLGNLIFGRWLGINFFETDANHLRIEYTSLTDLDFYESRPHPTVAFEFPDFESLRAFSDLWEAAQAQGIDRNALENALLKRTGVGRTLTLQALQEEMNFRARDKITLRVNANTVRHQLAMGVTGNIAMGLAGFGVARGLEAYLDRDLTSWETLGVYTTTGVGVSAALSAIARRSLPQLLPILKGLPGSFLSYLPVGTSVAIAEDMIGTDPTSTEGELIAIGAGGVMAAAAASAKLPVAVAAATGVVTAAEGGLTLTGAALGFSAGIAVGGALIGGAGVGWLMNKGYEYEDEVFDSLIQRALLSSDHVPEQYRQRGWKIRPT